MAYKFHLLIFSALFLHEFCSAFVVPYDVDWNNEVNALSSKPAKGADHFWMHKIFKNLGKYRNFYANLLQEENEKFAVEIQELYNLVSTALVEPNINKRKTMLYYSVWLVKNTKDLQSYLIAKGINKIT